MKDLFPGTAGVSPAGSVRSPLQKKQARRLRSQARHARSGKYVTKDEQ